MNRKLLILLVVIVALTTVSCKNKEKSKLPNKNDKVTEFATIPSFKVMFLALDKMQDTEMSTALNDEVNLLKKDTLHRAFSWGVLATDAQLAIQNKNAVRLKGITEQLIELAPLLAMQDIGTRIKDGVLPIIKTANWDVMETMYYNMQYTVEQTLLEKKQYEMYSLVTLGVWTETSLQLARMIDKDFSTEKASVLLQSAAWTSISQNLGLFTNKQYTQAQAYKTSRKQLKEIDSLMDIPSSGTFTQEQLKQLIDTTGKIRAAFLTSSK